MTARPAPRAMPDRSDLTLTDITDPSPDRYRDLYRLVGGQDWLWFSRLEMSDAALLAILNDPGYEVSALCRDGQQLGLLELDFRVSGECELAFFGVAPALIGTGAGRYLMEQALTRAFARPITRLHVHTCTLDSPQALGFYRRSGFTPISQQIEIAPDPRLTGTLPRDAAPHVPVLE